RSPRQSTQELVQTSERELRLALDASRGEHAKTRRQRDVARRVEQGGFADARVTANKQGIAPLAARRKHAFECLDFARAAIELGARRRSRDGHAGNYGRLTSLVGNYRVVVSPPSITKSAPVTLPARSLASSTTRSATCSGRVNWPVTASRAARLAT